jgi:hypothetical protein
VRTTKDKRLTASYEPVRRRPLVRPATLSQSLATSSYHALTYLCTYENVRTCVSVHGRTVAPCSPSSWHGGRRPTQGGVADFLLFRPSSLLTRADQIITFPEMPLCALTSFRQAVSRVGVPQSRSRQCREPCGAPVSRPLNAPERPAVQPSGDTFHLRVTVYTNTQTHEFICTRSLVHTSARC